MSFWLKKFISFWLMPVPGCLTLLIIGVWLTRRHRPSRTGRALLLLGIALFTLFGNKQVSCWLIHPLESHYPAIPALRPGQPLPANLAECRYVVVLGGGHADASSLAPLDRLSSSALARITEAVRIVRCLPQARLLVSGPGEPGFPAHAEILAETAESLGIPRSRIDLIDTARDTEEESHAIRARVGAAPIALVTSAVHMPRAVALCRHAGIRATPCPTDFQDKPADAFRLTDLTWDCDAISRSTWAVRESLGYLWLRLRGKI